jgi:hypothetical protein
MGWPAEAGDDALYWRHRAFGYPSPSRVDSTRSSPRVASARAMTIDSREHIPIVMALRGNRFFVGTFGEDGGQSELAVFDREFPSSILHAVRRSIVATRRAPGNFHASAMRR